MSEQAREWIVTVDDQHLDQLDEVVNQLKDAGMRVDRVLYSIGQITGCTRLAEASGDTATADPIRERLTVITGVVSVDVVQQYDIGPPDSEVQ